MFRTFAAVAAFALVAACGTIRDEDEAFQEFISQPNQMTEENTSTALSVDGIKDKVEQIVQGGFAYADNSPEYCKKVKGFYWQGLKYLNKVRAIASVRPDLALKPKVVQKVAVFGAKAEVIFQGMMAIEKDPTERDMVIQLHNQFVDALEHYAKFVSSKDPAELQTIINNMTYSFEPLARNLINRQCHWGF